MTNIAQSHQIKILVVDDIQDNLDLIEQILEEHPWEVSTALNAKSAIDQALASDFDLFLLDVHMPDVDGFELCRQLRREQKTKTIPVIFVTAERASTENVIEGLDAGGFDYITKPFDRAELLARIRVMLRMRHAEEELLVVQQALREQNQNLSSVNERLAEACQQMLEQRIELVRRSRQLERANAVKSEFLAKMSHELRTPLNSIIGFTDLMAADNIEPPGKRQTKRLEKVGRNGRHLLSLINDILDLSKIEADRMALTMAPVDIASVVHDCLAMECPLIGGKPVTLEKKIPDKIRVWEGDEVRLRQIIINLLSNAVKFTDSGSVTLEIIESPERLRISVIDTGVGIACEHLAYVFDHFRQVDSSSTRKAAGTGLGLPICRKLCSLMGGTIEAQSELGVGSTFVVDLPWRAEQMALEGAYSTDDDQTSLDQRVLLCSSDAGILDVTSVNLAAFGINVQRVDFQDDVTELLHSENPSGIIIDARWTNATKVWQIAASNAVDQWLTLWSEDHQLGYVIQVDELIDMPTSPGILSMPALIGGSGNCCTLLFTTQGQQGEQILASLETLGFKSTCKTGNISEAIETITNEKVLNIFVDISGYGFEALQLIDRIRQTPEWADVRIIAIKPSSENNYVTDIDVRQSDSFLHQFGTSTPTLLLDIAEKITMGRSMMPAGVCV